MYSYSPLRYPGGKSQLSRYILSIIKKNGLLGGVYVEPYAGGAGVAIFLLVHNHVSKIIINDIDYSIYSFWYAVKHHANELCTMIERTPVDIDNWMQQKAIQNERKNRTILEVGFSTFFLNRTNRSGIMKGGIIGGLKQDGSYKMDCRFNKENLIKRILKIAEYKDNIIISNEDAIKFLDEKEDLFNSKTLIYLDPPYYNKGQKLYVNYYNHDDHDQLKNFITTKNGNWIITYDDTEAINSLYANCNKVGISISYFAAEKRQGKEVMFYSPNLCVDI